MMRRKKVHRPLNYPRLRAAIAGIGLGIMVYGIWQLICTQAPAPVPPPPPRPYLDGLAANLLLALWLL